jgi:DNA polymerase III delta subunit
VRDAERARLIVRVLELSKRLGAINREIKALGPFDHRRPEREAARAGVLEALRRASRQLADIDRGLR